MDLYSVVIPLYNEEEVVLECIRRVSGVLEEIDGDYEVIFVNDGSRDRTMELVQKECEKNRKLKVLSFSRNFGHQIAITAGMDHAQGDAVIVMDADLQDPPEVIKDLIAKYKEGYDVVYAVRSKRKGETFFKKFTSKVFYRFLRYMCNIDIPVDTGDFRLISRKVCNVMKSLTERNRYVRGLVSWVGFKQAAVEYVREERFAGETKYPLRKMLKLSMDGITSFSTKPLTMSKNLGFLTAAAGFIYMIVVVLQKFVFGKTVQGWASLAVLILLLGGIQLIMLGFIGEYIARIFDESKNRPLYIIEEKINIEKE
ncbi:MAG: glycosyltransferase family 2 protein [Clostridia bacterium]|nr:glycosyltransferase family 2 protein [Clostridia bacterium]MBN2884291.1 glycosyltransferase family 2 protein [Clostridia bacterium]